MNNDDNRDDEPQPTFDSDAAPGMTISQFMSQHGRPSRISLDGGGQPTPVPIETDAEGRKYEVGDVVAKGGMGAILSAKDVNIRRTVAMKVMLNPREVAEPQIVRFIEEAQVTGQLEHPSIVPVYELGMDASGNVFYTMKFVRGTTLKDVINGISEGDQRVIDQYPLPRLLNVFLRTCDALAFAHAKNVVHRDLKPENVMVGEYGEVLVMDWGLAKVLAKSPGGPLAPAAVPDDDLALQQSAAIESLRDDETGDSLRTLDGQVMGTPRFMAPEQALGKIDEIDARTDIYALGAILYNILTLRPPIEGKTVHQVLLNVSQGKITPPSALNADDVASQRRRSRARALDPRELQKRAVEASGRARQGEAAPAAFPHCPGGGIPAALSAVVMRALALEQDDRYQTVKELQADIDAYQGGFATAAEEAGALRQLLLLVKRHKTEFGLIAAGLLILIAVVAGFVVKVNAEKNAARAAERTAVDARAAAEAHQAAAEGALTRLERENYRNVIALAAQKIRDGEIVQAEKLLWQAPVGLRGWEWGRCMYLCNLELLTLKGDDTSRIRSVAFSPDGRFILSASGDSTARIWDAATGRKISESPRAKGGYAAAFSPDGRLVATGDKSKRATLWDARTGKERWSQLHDVAVSSLGFSPDSRLLATAEGDWSRKTNNKVRVWDAATGELLVTMPYHGRRINSVAFSPDGTRVLTATNDQAVCIWETATARRLQTLKCDDYAYCAIFLPGGDRLVVSLGCGDLRCYEWLTGKQVGVFRGHSDITPSLSISADGKLLASGSRDRTARVWDLGTDRQVLLIRTHAPVYSIAFSPDAKCLAAGCWDGAIRIWDAVRSNEAVTVPGTNFARFTPDARHVITQQWVRTKRSSELRFGDVTGESAFRAFATCSATCTGAVTAGAVSSDGRRLVTGCEFGELAIWDVGTRRKLLDLPGNSEMVLDVAFSSDGTRVATTQSRHGTGSEHSETAIWDAETGAKLVALQGHTHMVHSVDFSPDDARLVTAGYDGTARIWDTETGAELRVFKGAGYSAVFSPDGRSVAAGQDDGNVVVWDAETGGKLRTFEGHSNTAWSVGFSPDGRRIVSGSMDRTCRVWDAETGHELLVVGSQGVHVSSVEFSRDGRLLATASDDVTVWPALDWTWTPEQVDRYKRERYTRWLARNR